MPDAKTDTAFRNRAAILMAAVCLAVTPAGLAEAQTAGAPATEPPADCVVAPDPDATTETTPEITEPGRGDAATLSDCDGMLKPAPVGDGELVEPAPDTGKTPVIDPDEVPPQAPAE